MKLFGNFSDEEEISISESAGVRTLHFGSPAIQSAMRISKPERLELAYTRAMMACLLFSEPEKFLLIGLGGGSLAKFIHNQLPKAHTVAVEISRRVVNLAHSMFQLPEPNERLKIVIGDGSDYVAKCGEGYDVIMLDAYGENSQPDSLTNVDFYKKARSLLNPDGILVVNLWGSDKRFETYLSRIESVFEGLTLCLPAERKGNIIVFGFERFQGTPLWIDLKARAARLKERHGLEFPELLENFKKMNRATEKRLII